MCVFRTNTTLAPTVLETATWHKLLRTILAAADQVVTYEELPHFAPLVPPLLNCLLEVSLFVRVMLLVTI